MRLQGAREESDGFFAEALSPPSIECVYSGENEGFLLIKYFYWSNLISPSIQSCMISFISFSLIPGW